MQSVELPFIWHAFGAPGPCGVPLGVERLRKRCTADCIETTQSYRFVHTRPVSEVAPGPVTRVLEE